jgi:hypothetical protein
LGEDALGCGGGGGKPPKPRAEPHLVDFAYHCGDCFVAEFTLSEANVLLAMTY